MPETAYVWVIYFSTNPSHIAITRYEFIEVTGGRGVRVFNNGRREVIRFSLYRRFFYSETEARDWADEWVSGECDRLDELIKKLHKPMTVQIVGPKLVFPDGPLRL